MQPIKTSTDARTAIMAVYFAFGAMVGGFSGSFPVIMAGSGIGRFEFGLGTMLSMLADVIAMSAAGAISRRYSNRAMLLVLLPALGLAAFAFMTSASPVMFFVANIAYGAAMGGTDIFMNGEGSAIERDLQRPVFSTFHGALSCSIVVFALIGSALSTMASPWMTWAFQAVALSFAWVCVYRNVPARQHPPTESNLNKPLQNKIPLALIGAVAGICFAAELSALIWSAQLLDEQAPRLAVIAGLGAAFYGICNATVRSMGDRLRKRFDDLSVLLVSISVAILGFVLLGLSSSFTMSVMAFAVVGFGAALLTPCSWALAASYAPQNRVAALSFAGAIAGTPRVVAPLLFGWVASSHGLGSAFGLLASALAVAFGIAVALARGYGLALTSSERP